MGCSRLFHKAPRLNVKESSVPAIVLFVLIGISRCYSDMTVRVGNFDYTGVLKQDQSFRYYAFYGIPYARQPVGRFRFTRPETLDRLDEWQLTSKEREMYTRQVMAPQTCPQMDPFHDGFDVSSSEDCLRVDIYVNAQVLDNDDGRISTAAAILIEGFNFKQSIGHKVRPEVSFLRKQNEIGALAVIHYRLGALGFLTTEDDDGPANLGLWDQYVALRFISSSARHFKIDPERMTVMGFGSGGIAVSIHMVNDRSNILFKNAIISGGSALGPDGSIQFAKDRAIEFGHELGCTSTKSRKLIQCLREVALPNLVAVSSSSQFTFGPVVDKNHTDDHLRSYIADSPNTLIRQATFTNMRAVLYGYPENAGTLRYYSMQKDRDQKALDRKFLSQFPSRNETSSTLRSSRAVLGTTNEDKGSLERRIGDYLSPFQHYGDTIKTLAAAVKFVYFRNYTDNQVLANETLFGQLMSEALTDYLSFSPVITMAHLHADKKIQHAQDQGSRQTTGVYIYARRADAKLWSFSRNMPAMLGPSGRLIGTYMDDILQIVGVEGVTADHSRSQNEKLQNVWSDIMQNMFARNEDPKDNYNGISEYNPKARDVVYITELTQDAYPRSSNKPFREGQRLFWSSFVPTIQETLDQISLKSQQRHDSVQAFQKSTWGMTAGFVVLLLVAALLGVLLWRTRSQKQFLSGGGQVRFQTVSQNEPSARI